MNPDTRSPVKLAAVLQGRPFRHFPTIPSTNDFAMQWLREGASDGALVIADHQTQGRGRQGRDWYSPIGTALTFSLIWRCQVHEAAQATMLAAVAVYDLLVALKIKDVAIKWPNDILITERKVCGILSEALWDNENFVGVVLGIGLNIHVDFSGTELSESAISLQTASLEPCERTEILRQLLSHLDQLRPYMGSSTLFRNWRSKLTSLGRPVTIQNLRGIASAVDDSGALWLELPDGQKKRILSGTLQEWRDSS